LDGIMKQDIDDILDALDDQNETIRQIKQRLMIYDILFFVTFAVAVAESIKHYFF
jgi:hypothetical protein